MGSRNTTPQLVGRIKGLITIAIIAAASSAAPAWAACDTWSLNASGNWFGAGGWSAGDPNSVSTDACIIDGASTVTMNGSANVANFSLGSGNILNVGGSTLTVNGASLSNGGNINIGNGNLTIGGAASTVLSGGGTISLTGDVFVNQNTAGSTLTNQDNLIQGTGQIGQNGLKLINGGTISANISGGNLFLNGSGLVTNTGLLTATNGGSLQISNNVVNTGGNITANGGTVTLSSVITGGTLNSKNSGTLTSSNATLSGVTVSNNTTYNVGGTTLLQGTITNNGIITAPNTSLTVNGGDVTLQGGGSVNMTGDAFFNLSSAGLTLHNVDNTIQGTGQLGQNGLAVDNQAAGKIIANINGGNLFLNGGGVVTNAGLLEATNGGALQISNHVINTGANITADGGTVVVGSTITGGTLNSINSGTLTSTSATLNGVTISNGTSYNVGGTTLLQGTITNNGTILVPNTNLTISGDVTLQGGGSVNMTGDAFFNLQAAGQTLHNVNNTIQGTGQLGQNGLILDNQAAGKVLANINGGTLFLNGGGLVTNAGLLEATNGGILQINNTVNNSSNITADGGTVSVNSIINGGTLNALNGGTLTSTSATLNGVTISSGTTYNVGGTTLLQGTINNQGIITVPNTNLTVSGGDVTLKGGGTVTMANDAFFNLQAAGQTLHNVDNTIQGTGQLGQNGLAVDNQAAGKVIANIANGTLSLNGGGVVTNAGLLQATNSGILSIFNTVNNSSNITADGGTVNINSRINGGTLNALNGGVMNANGGSILNGLTISTGTTVTDTSTTLLIGTINNKGTISLPNTNLTVSGGDVTLQGGGTVTMANDAFFNLQAAGQTLHNVDNTIQGTGQLGQNGLAIDNQAGGKIVANVNGGTLNVNGGGTVTNAGTLKATNGGSLVVSSPLSAANFAGNTLQGGGTYVVNGTTGVSTLQVNSFGITGGEVNTIGANTTVTLIGSNANVQFLDGRGLNALNLSANQGNLNLEGGYNLTTAALVPFANSGNVLVDASSALTTGAGSYLQTGGETQVDGTITADFVEISGGVLRGGNGTLAGHITGTVENDCSASTCGTVRAGDDLNVPVDPPGNLSIGGDYIHNSGATLIVDIAGAAPAQTSQLNVAGNVQLLGANDFLTISLLNNYVPQTTGKFLFMTYAGTLNAQDFSLTDPNVDPNGVFKVDYATAGDIFLDFTATGSSVTPEPSFLLPVIGLLGLVVVYRKRRQSRAKA